MFRIIDSYHQFLIIGIHLDDVDRVEELRAVLEMTNTSSRNNIRLYWDPPKHPNGAVVSYTIVYELQTQDTVEEKRCITESDYIQLDYQHNGYVLTGLISANYSIRIRTNTLAGEGLYSRTIYVYIPVIISSLRDISF